MDTRLNQNETELGVLVLAVALKVLADSDSLYSTSVLIFSILRFRIYIHLLDEHVQILRKVGGEACKNLSVSLNRTEACMLMFFQRKTVFWESSIMRAIAGFMWESYRSTSEFAEFGYLNSDVSFAHANPNTAATYR